MDVYWMEQCLADVPDADDWLAPGEQSQLARFHVTKRRGDWRLGRWTAKSAFCALNGLAADSGSFRKVEVSVAADGSPFIAGSSLSVSLSHSAGRSVCAIGDQIRIGCDIEEVRSLSEQFAADYFTAREQRLLERAHEYSCLAMLIWSAKESVLKALRTGLREDTRAVCVRPASGSGVWQPLEAVYGSNTHFTGWWRGGDRFVRTLITAVPVSPPVLLRTREEKQLTVAAQ